MAAVFNVVSGDDGGSDPVTRTIHKKNAEDALKTAREFVAGENLPEFAHMLAVQTRREITEFQLVAWELGVGETVPADVLLAACYLCGDYTVSDLIGVGAQDLERLLCRVERLERGRA